MRLRLSKRKHFLTISSPRKVLIFDVFAQPYWSDDFQFLVENYPDLDYNISPSPNVNQPIQINVQLALYNIISMVTGLIISMIFFVMFSKNEKDQTLTTNCEKIFSWNDMFLRSFFLNNNYIKHQFIYLKNEGGTQRTLEI